MNFKISLFFKGMLMGIAEIIPGVSGDKLAFITGIYQELINSIKSINIDSIRVLTKFQFKKFWRQINGSFLFSLLIGMITSVLLLSRLITYLLNNYNFQIWGFFFGLIIASAFLISKSVSGFNFLNYLCLILGLVISAYISLVAPSTSPNSSFFIFLSGALAISAMILPGISGSFILVFLSKYEFILNSLNSFDINVLSVFILGCIFGLITFSRVLSYLFKKFNDIVISTLVGFLLGSLIKIWPFFEVIEYDLNNEPIYTNPVFPTTELLSEIISFSVFSLVGIFTIWVLEKKFIGISKSN